MDNTACCISCSQASDLFTSECTHIKLCAKCGKTFAESNTACRVCGNPVQRLTKEFAVKINPSQKQYFLGKFSRGLPEFGGKRPTSQWKMHKEAAPGTSLKDKSKAASRTWVLENIKGGGRFVGQPDMSLQSNFFLLSMHGRDFLAMPGGTWYNFSKQVKRDAYTIEEAEAIMKGNRRMQQEIQNKWLQKMGLKVEGETGGEKAGGGSKRGRRSGKGGEIDDDEDRPRMKGGKGGDDDEDDAAAKEESEGDDDAGEKGEEWEHDETFTDDDEAVGVEKEDKVDEDADMPPPPTEEDEKEEDEGFLLGQPDSQKQEKKEPEEEEDAEDESDLEFSPIFQSKKLKEEKSEPPTSAEKPAEVSKPGASKRKTTDTEKATQGTKKAKVEGGKTTGGKQKVVEPPPQKKQPVTEAEVRAILSFGQLTTKDLLSRLKDRLQTDADKSQLKRILAKVGKLEDIGGVKYMTLKK